MKILIENSGYGLGNLGDIAMLQIAISRLKNLFPDSCLQVFTDSPDRLTLFCPSATPLTTYGRGLYIEPWNILGGINKLIPQQFHQTCLDLEHGLRVSFPYILNPWINYRLARRGKDITLIDNYLQTIAEADLVIATGGGYINDSFPRHAEIILKTLQAAQKSGKPTALLGQGIGPLSDKRLRNIARQVFKNVSFIGLREGQLGTQILSELGISSEKVMITGDDAIEIAYKNRTQSWGNNIGVNIRISPYSPVEDESLKIIRSILHQFAKDVDSSLQPIPISFNSTNSTKSDLTSISALLENSTEKFKSENLREIPNTETIIRLVGNCRLVVTGSYHAAVFSLSQGIPAIGLSKSEYYVSKFAGLQKQFGEGITPVFMESPTFEEDLKIALENTWYSSERWREELLLSAQKQIELGITLYNQLPKLLNSKDH